VRLAASPQELFELFVAAHLKISVLRKYATSVLRGSIRLPFGISERIIPAALAAIDSGAI